MAGYQLGVDAGGGGQVVVRRYLVDGALDAAFGVGGEATLDCTVSGEPLDDRALALALEPRSGKIVIGGLSGHGVWVFDWEQWLIARFTSLGELDTTFGAGDGFVVGPKPGTAWWQANAVAVAAAGAFGSGGMAATPVAF